MHACACMCMCYYINFFSSSNDRIILFKNVWTDSIPVQWYRKWSHWEFWHCMALCIINLNSLLIIPSCTRKGSLSCRHQWLIGPSIILPPPPKWILHSWIWLLFTREKCPNTAVFHIKDQMWVRLYFQIRDRILK